MPMDEDKYAWATRLLDEICQFCGEKYEHTGTSLGFGVVTSISCCPKHRIAVLVDGALVWFREAAK